MREYLEKEEQDHLNSRWSSRLKQFSSRHPSNLQRGLLCIYLPGATPSPARGPEELFSLTVKVAFYSSFVEVSREIGLAVAEQKRKIIPAFLLSAADGSKRGKLIHLLLPRAQRGGCCQGKGESRHCCSLLCGFAGRPTGKANLCMASPCC